MLEVVDYVFFTLNSTATLLYVDFYPIFLFLDI